MDRDYSWDDQNPEEMQSWHEFQGEISEPSIIDSVSFLHYATELNEDDDEDELDDVARIEALTSKIKNRFRSSEEQALAEIYQNHISGDLDATLKLGIHLMFTGEFANAEPLLRQVHESGNPNGTRFLGILELRMGNFQSAKELLQEALIKGAPNTNYWLYWALAKLGKAEESEKHLAAAYLEKDVQAIFKLGLISSKNGDLDSSKKFFIEGMNLGHSNSAKELINLLKSMNHKKVEISLYKQAVQENNSLALSALEFLTLGRYGDAIQDLKKDIPK